MTSLENKGIISRHPGKRRVNLSTLSRENWRRGGGQPFHGKRKGVKTSRPLELGEGIRDNNKKRGLKVNFPDPKAGEGRRGFATRAERKKSYLM